MKKSGSLWQYNTDDPNDNLVESESFKYKYEIIGETPPANNTRML